MTIITVTSGNVGGGVGGKTTITLALLMSTKNVAYMDLSRTTAPYPYSWALTRGWT